MGMARNLFNEISKRTQPKPVSLSIKDADGDEIGVTVTTVGTPKDYSLAEIQRVAAANGVKSAGKRKLTTGITLSMPRTDAIGTNAKEIIGIAFGEAVPPAGAADLAADALRNEKEELAAADA